MPKLKVDKHIVYTLMMNNLDWFGSPSEAGERYFLTRFEIENRINRYLKKEYDAGAKEQQNDSPYISLNASTLTAMVHDGVLERQFSDKLRCYTYRPTPEKEKGYCVEYIDFPQRFS